MDGKNEIDKERILNYKEWLLGHYAPEYQFYACGT